MTIVDSPPNTLPRIDKIWAFLSVDEAGNEGVCAGPLAGPFSLVPFIAADEARLKSLEPFVVAIAIATGMKIKLVEFSSRTEVRTIDGRS